jgi:transaldolase
MPMATLHAAADHSEVTTETVKIDPSEDLAALAGAGIDLDDVTDKLLKDGIEAFVTPMKKLLEGIETKRAEA